MLSVCRAEHRTGQTGLITVLHRLHSQRQTLSWCSGKLLKAWSRRWMNENIVLCYGTRLTYFTLFCFIHAPCVFVHRFDALSDNLCNYSLITGELILCVFHLMDSVNDCPTKDIMSLTMLMNTMRFIHRGVFNGRGNIFRRVASQGSFRLARKRHGDHIPAGARSNAVPEYKVSSWCFVFWVAPHFPQILFLAAHICQANEAGRN